MNTSSDDLIIYKKMVDFCEHNQLKDYFTDKPLLCYMNREPFMKLLKTQIKTQKTEPIVVNSPSVMQMI